MTVVSDSSPLIVLAKLGCFHFLKQLYFQVCISKEVHDEVVVAGAGLPGASEVVTSQWIDVKTVRNMAKLSAMKKSSGLGTGELSTIILCQEISAEMVLLDDFHARELARQEGLRVRGTVGVLEALYRRGYGIDLRSMFQQLIAHNAYIDKRLLDRRLRSLGLDPL